MTDDSQLIINAGVRVFDTGAFHFNAVSVKTSTEKSWGICGSMSARWIKESLRKGRPLERAGEIGSELTIGITQAAFLINGEGSMSKYLFDIFDLTPAITKRGSIVSWREVTALAAAMSGYVSFTIKGNGGHAMAFCMNDKLSHYFDPNCGMYAFADKQRCAHAVACYMKVNYDAWKGGEYALYQVT